MPKRIPVTVTPQPPSGKAVGATFSGGPHVTPDGQITLDSGNDYDIVFTLAPAHGVNEWRSADPFGNDISCPSAAKGATAPFSQGAIGRTSMTVHVRNPTAGELKYRLNYNDELNTDPIMIII